jgi:hypothetical protein
MKRILFYISGHGYGHLTRCLEVIKKIQLIEPDCDIHIQTSAPEWLIALNLKNYKLIPKTCDIGAVQKNSYDVDQKTTLESFANFYNSFDQRIPQEVDYNQKNKIDLIVGDIPPLAFWAATESGIPAIAMANFSWDWIYEPYVSNFPEFAWIIDKIKQSYSKANLLLRLPFHGDLNAFPNIVDIPFVARKAWMDLAEVRQKLRIELTDKLVLVALRKEDLDQVNFDNLAKNKNNIFLFFTPVPQHSNFVSITANFLAFPNLIAASDVVMSKPGYGIISECFTNKTPLLYTSRINFLEYDILVGNLQKTNSGLLIPRNDFLMGNWGGYIKKIENENNIWPDWSTNGAEIATSNILNF